MRLLNPISTLLLIGLQLTGTTHSTPSPSENDVLVVSSVLTVYEDPTGTSPPTTNSKSKKPTQTFFQANKGAIIGGSIAGGIIILGVFGFVLYKVRQSNRRWEDDEYLKTSANPFKSTLDQYHVGHS